jgi:ABC-2 type transport system ATP-binding protein
MLNETGTTILFSSHYMSDVERLAARVVMLHDGQVLIDNQLDDLRESFSLALVPHDSTATRERLLGLSGCLGVRERSDALHVVFRHEPDAAQQLLARELSLPSVRCRTVALEEMFIELAGGQ